MTFRSIVIGILLGLAISALTGFNDMVIRQTSLIGCKLPIALLGVLLVWLFLIGPTLRQLGVRLKLRATEIAVMIAIAMAACGWPGGSFMKIFPTNIAMPAYLQTTKTAWKSTQAMAYAPGTAPMLTQAYIRDAHGLAEHLINHADDEDSFAGRLWQNLSRTEPVQLQEAIDSEDDATVVELVPRLLNVYVKDGPPNPTAELLDRDPVLRTFVDARDAFGEDESDQRALADQRVRRQVLSVVFQGNVAPAPQPRDILIANGNTHAPVIRGFVNGDRDATLSSVPWGQWWPTLRIWGFAALLLGVGSLCLALICYPQWAHNELLPFPVGRFMHDVVQSAPKSFYSDAFRNTARLFWVGLIAAVLFHLLNGLAQWDLWFFKIPLKFDFSALEQLFPSSRTVQGVWAVSRPRFYITVVAFAFFLAGDVSLSLGLAGIVWVAFCSVLIGHGIAIRNSYIGFEMHNLMLFGGYIGGAAMVLYLGRRHYLNVAKASIGLKRHSDTPSYAVHAARILAVCSILTVAILCYAGLHVLWAVLMVVLIYCAIVMVARINAETGAIFVQPFWLPVGILTGLLGFKAIGPENYILLAIASVVLIGDTRELLMTYLCNGLWFADKASDNKKPARIGRLAGPMGLMIVVGFIVALGVTLWLGYVHGANIFNPWARGILPAQPFDSLARYASQAQADGDLAGLETIGMLQRLSFAEVSRETLAWIGLGLGLVAACWIARVRLPWWPLHPVIFLVWGTYPGYLLASSFLMGWFIRTGVTKLGGMRGYEQTKPLMIGLIAGELLAAMGWIIAGAIYYLSTGTTPPAYSVFRI